MKVEKMNCGDGIEFSVLRTDKFKNDILVVNFLMPKTEKNIAVGNLLSKMFLRGTEKHSTNLGINRVLAGLYDASVSVAHIALPDAMCFRLSCNFVDDRFIPDGDRTSVLSGVISMIKEMLEFPLTDENGNWKEEYIKSEKSNLLDELRAQKNNKDSFALRRFSEIWHEGMSMALNSGGTEDSITEVTSADLNGYLGEMKKTAPADVVFAGNYTAFKEEKCLEFIKFLSGLRSGCKTNYINAVPEIAAAEKLKEVREETDAKQSRMLLGYRIDKSGASGYARSVFCEIFGGSPTSRLFTNVRERLSLCYYCSATYSESTGELTVRSGLDAETRDKAADEIARQLKLLADAENISSGELEAAKKGLVNMYKSINDNVYAYSSWYLSSKLCGLDTDIDNYVSGVCEVTAEQVAVVASAVKQEISYILVGNVKE